MAILWGKQLSQIEPHKGRDFYLEIMGKKQKVVKPDGSKGLQEEPGLVGTKHFKFVDALSCVK